jgi:hypothetical protein
LSAIVTCACGQWRGHPDAQSCLETQYGDLNTAPGGLYDGVIKVGNPDVVVAGYPAQGDPCGCYCHEDAD